MRQPGSTRAIGQGTIAVDLHTRERLKAIAGDKPVSQFLRDWTTEVLKQAPLPGTGKLTAPMTATKSDLAQMRGEMVKMMKALAATVGIATGQLETPKEFWTGEKYFYMDDVYDLAKAAGKAKQAERAVSAQGELELT